MNERQLKGLTLFFLESIIVLDGKISNDDFVEAFNDFIYEQYEFDQKSLSVIFNVDMLGEFIEKKYDILNLEQIIQLVRRYPGIQNYIKLIDEIGIEDDKKINSLVLLFSMKYQERINLRFLNDKTYFPKGYPRILQ